MLRRRAGRLPAALALCALAGACSLGPVLAPPRVETPPAWVVSSAGLGEWPDPTWWHAFESAELDALIAEAIDRNTDLAAAVSRIRQAQAQTRIAGAALQPQLAASSSAGRSWAEAGGGARAGARSSGLDGTTSLQGALAASYQVDLFGRNAASADAARTRLLSSRYDRATVAITLYAGVANAYFQVLAARDRIRLATETLRIAEEVLQVLERRREVGVSSDLEVAQQRAAVASQRASIVGLQQSERQSLDALAVLLGRIADGFDVRGRSLAEMQLPQIRAGIPSELLLRRPDLRRAEADLAAANLDIVAARAARFPTLDLAARISSDGAVLGELFSASGLVYAATASLAAPIFAGGRLAAQEELSAERYRELSETYRGAILGAFRDAVDSLSAASTTRLQHAYAWEAYEQASEAYRIAEARFRAGAADFLTVLDAQRTLFQANDAVVQSALGQSSALVNLYTALGGGWDGEFAPVPPPPPLAAE